MAGDIIRFKLQGKDCWGRVTGYGMQFTTFGVSLADRVFVQTIMPNSCIVIIAEEDILEVHIPKEKVEFS